MPDDSPLEKPYSLTFEDRPGYLYAYVEGVEDSYRISNAYWREISGEIAARRIGKVLIDENITGNGTIADAFQFASEIPNMGFGRTRIAFVDRHLEQDDVNRFGELVALNRGVNCKVFNAIDEAVVWLVQERRS